MSCLLRPRLTAAYIALHESGRLDRLGGAAGRTVEWGARRVFASRRCICICILHWEVGQLGARDWLASTCASLTSRSSVFRGAGWLAICLL